MSHDSTISHSRKIEKQKKTNRKNRNWKNADGKKQNSEIQYLDTPKVTHPPAVEHRILSVFIPLSH